MRSELTDLALDLATPGRFDAERRMAAAVGDAGIRIGFWNAAAERYEDSAGRSVEVERAGRGANVTYVGGGDQPRAVMIGSQAALADAWAQAALSRAVTLLTRNSELRALVQEQIAEVDSSRRRIAEAADEERRGLRVELQESLLPRVAALEAELARLDSGAGTTSLGSTREQLRAVQADLLAIADGLAPGGFAGSRGIADALAALAAKSPVSTVLDAAVAHEPGRNLAACLYFVASEGLTNAERHANATRIHIRLAIADRVRLEISDDGQGGAETRPGHGLDGLRERVSAMGGELKMVSPVLGGTTLVADLPLGALVDLGPDSIEEDVDLEGLEGG
jgi:signal transduction histidine kinase